MSHNYKTTHVLLLTIFSITLFLTEHALAGRVILEKNPTPQDKKNPQFLLDHDRSYLVPGIGRFMLPPKHGYNPFTYNPVTGTNGGTGIGIGDDSAGAGHTQIPGGDDTGLPSPGAGVPIPEFGGSSPPSAHP